MERSYVLLRKRSASRRRPSATRLPTGATTLRLQRAVGNAAVGRLLRQPTGKDPATEFAAVRDRVAAGGSRDKGAFENGAFKDHDLQLVLEHYAALWGTQPAGSTYGTKKGDSEGADIASLPPWFSAFQNKIIRASVWGADERAVAALLQAFLRAQYPSAPPAVMEFFGHVGQSETNKQAETWIPGAHSYNWCAAASTDAVVRGLHELGYFFQGAAGKPATDQDGAYLIWLNNPKFRKERQVNSPAAYTESLAPGDKMTIRGSRGPKSGHVVTVVEDRGTTVRYVSGNAADRAVRFEEATRSLPPKGYRWSVTEEAPPAGEIWTVIIEKASRLDPRTFDKLRDVDPAQWSKVLAENNLVYVPPKLVV